MGMLKNIFLFIRQTIFDELKDSGEVEDELNDLICFYTNQVDFVEETVEGYKVETLDVRFKDTADKINHLVGKTTRIYIPSLIDSPLEMGKMSKALSTILARYLEPFYGGTLLICGIGNPRIAEDSLGPVTIERLDVFTLNSIEEGSFNSTKAIAPNVQGRTNIGTVDYISAIGNKIEADCVLLIDAAKGDISQQPPWISVVPAGLKPSKNNLPPITQETIGIPIIAITYPTVFKASSTEDDYVLRNIDQHIIRASKVIAMGIMGTLMPWADDDLLNKYTSTDAWVD